MGRRTPFIKPFRAWVVGVAAMFGGVTAIDGGRDSATGGRSDSSCACYAWLSVGGT
jgi:hypothetical protein